MSRGSLWRDITLELTNSTGQGDVGKRFVPQHPDPQAFDPTFDPKSSSHETTTETLSSTRFYLTLCLLEALSTS
jgi:hypothetical protein